MKAKPTEGDYLRSVTVGGICGLMSQPKEDVMKNFEVKYIDTCLACYLTDHHNRDGEWLLGVPVDGETTWADVKYYVEGEAATGDLPAGYDWEDVKAAIEAAFPGDLTRLFDASLELPPEDGEPGDESVLAWYLLKWEVT